MNDLLGDRMKLYEGESDKRLMPLLPVMLRLDGNNFSKFTAKLQRPYDERLSNLMADTARYLAMETNACLAYTQSDEITLILNSNNFDSKIYFDGRIFKIQSILAAKCSVFFNTNAQKAIPIHMETWGGAPPVFDCRVWNVPNKAEAANTVLWREYDATRNSILGAGYSLYSHNEMMNKNTSQVQEMLWQKGVNWNDYPSFFKRGTYIRKIKTFRPFTAEELDQLPAKHHARQEPNLQIERTDFVRCEFPPMGRITNRVEVIFEGAEPLLKNEEGEG